MAKFFIDRPIFAWVIAIMMMMAGILAIQKLPISQYPEVAPPSISISARYPGASAQTVQDTITQVIEQQMNGIDKLRYMESTSSSDGSVTITITFEQGMNVDTAQVQVQNKLQLAMPLLPQAVQQLGVTVKKATRNYLMVMSLSSTDGSMAEADLSDYIASNLLDPVSRVQGVGDIQLFGAQYAMRIWLDPDKLVSYGLSVGEVTAAIVAQNAQVSAGEIGGAPAAPGQRIAATIVAQTRLTNAEEFKEILVKVQPDGSQVKLKHIARVERGSEFYGFTARFNGNPASGMGIKLASGANALETSRLVKEKISSLAPYFPHGVKVSYPNDTAPFVRLSIEEVVKTLIEAVILVFLVMYLFLQNIRATLIPTLAVPVVLLGTFAVLGAAGFSINTLTMFGMVLAIGLLVDDAIIVVENVERLMSEEKLPPKEATKKSMEQITGALVGVAMVLAAVFIPMAFFGGSTGVIYRQFSITIASAMALSVVVAIVFTPALCATMLKAADADAEHGAKRGFFGWFNRMFERLTNGYTTSVGLFVKRWGRSLFVYVAITVVMGWLFIRIPTAFLPDEDQGMAMLSATLPAGATQDQTVEVLKKMENYMMTKEKDAVQEVFTVAGIGFGGRGQNAGLGFVKLKDWSERKDEKLKVKAVLRRTMGYFMTFKEALAYAVLPPAIMELGSANGFDFRLVDRGKIGHEKLMDARNQLLMMARQDSGLTSVRPTGLDDTPQFHVDVDNEKVSVLSLSISDVSQTLSTAWGSSYVNDFIDNGRVKRVYMQGDMPFRMKPEDIGRWYVKNRLGEMVPFSAFSKTSWIYGSPALERFNGEPSVALQGNAAEGLSSGTAMLTMEKLAEKLPEGTTFAWSGLSYEERAAGQQAGALYAISILVIFLCLAALYESWSIPVAVMLVVPLGVIGTVLAVTMRGLANDVYFQVGLLTTVGLSAKNAILIVEFAKEAHEKGMELAAATVHAARLRLRPILMTSLAFGFGVLPLAIASGAGSGSQNAIGTSVLGGMISATVLAIFLVPVFFVVVTKLFKSDKKYSHAVEVPAVSEKTEGKE